MRVLILSANTGGGHNAAAVALSEQLEKLNIDYEIADTLAFISERVSDFISWGHSYVYRKFPKLFGWGYRFEERHPPRFIYEQCSKGAESLHQFIEEKQFDVVICVHVFSGMMMTEVGERYGSTIPSYFVSTDYTCSPGVAEMKVEKCIIPHRMLLGEFVRCGVHADKMMATGIPVRRLFYEQEEKSVAREALGLPQDRTVVLVSFGSMGCGKLEKNVSTLIKGTDGDICYVVLCGNNTKTYELLAPYENERLRVVSFTKEIQRYMTAADIYITKPGGLTTSEAIVKQLPMILINAVPGCETRNFHFLVQMGVAVGAKNWKQAAMTVNQMVEKPELREEMIKAMKLFSPDNAAERICRQIIRAE